MSGSDKVSRHRGCAKDGKAVGRAGTQASPRVVDTHVADVGHDRLGGSVQALYGVRIHALVEAGFLDRRAYNNAAVAARDDVHLGRANGVLNERPDLMACRGWHDAEHLPFHGTRRRTEGLDLSSPRSRAVHDRACGVKRLRRADPGRTSPQNGDFSHSRSGRKISATVPRSFFQCGAQFARIDAALRQEIRTSAKCYERFDTRKLAVVEGARANAVWRLVCFEESNRSSIAQVGRFESLVAQFAHKLGIHVCAGRDHSSQRRRIVRIAVGDHASRCVRSFARRLTLFDDEHAGAVTPQAPRQRESNDPSADDHNVPCLHNLIVVESDRPTMRPSSAKSERPET